MTEGVVLVELVCFLSSVSFNQTNQMNQTNKATSLLRHPELEFRAPLQLQTFSSASREF